jgi:hypothetical protein
MKYFICCLGFSFFLFCSTQQSEKPGIPDEKISRIMADLNVAEAATNGMSGYPKDSLMKVYFNQVFEMHGTSAEAYEKDLRLVSADLPRLQQIVLQSVKLLGGEIKGVE